MGLSNRQDSHPWMQWYPDAWITDNELALCGWEAKGLWADMLFRAFRAPERGVLPGDPESLSFLVGGDPERIRVLLERLEANKVFSRGADVDPALPPDAIVSRRMYREHVTRRRRSQAGAAGGKISKRKANPKQTLSKPKAKAKQNNLSNSADDNDLHGKPISKTKANAKQTPKPRSNSNSTELELVNRKCAPPAESENKGLEGVGDVLGRLGVRRIPSADLQLEYLSRIWAVTQDSPAWMRWWGKVINALMAAEALEVLEGPLTYAEDCKCPQRRKLKDLGPLRQPGAYLAKRILEECNLKRIKIPEHPGKGARK